MAAPILPVSGIAGLDISRPSGASSSGGAFRDAFTAAIDSVEGLRSDAAASVERFLAGDEGELHTAVLATQRAGLAFEFFLQARNKVVNAYQEIMRMQI